MKVMSYYDDHGISVNDYDEIISAHPFIHACNMSITYRLMEYLGFSCEEKVVLDVGTGTGQVARLLSGIPGLAIEACDIDIRYQSFFQGHPELLDVPFLCLDIINTQPEKRYDAAICRGVYHHIPKSRRPLFLKALCSIANLVIVSDEGILEYENNEERLSNCDSWYSYIINEARRRGLTKLAEAEHTFWKNEYDNSADEGGDFKESPTHLLEDAKKVGIEPVSIDRLGPWNQEKGGFFTATFVLQQPLFI